VSSHSVNHEHCRSQERFDSVYERGIRHFAWSNYHPASPTYPLADHFDTVPANALGCPNAEHGSPSPPGADTGDSGHYCSIGSTFETDNKTYDRPWRELFSSILEHLYFDDGGGIVINHPRRSGLSTEKLEELLDFDPRVLGIEVWNHRGLVEPKYRGRGNALSVWDELLMDDRLVYGFFNPDYHSIWVDSEWGQPARGRNVLLVPERTEAAAARAYRRGHVIGSLDGNGLRFERIEPTEDAIAVETNSAARIDFISAGHPVSVRYDRSATYERRGDERYVRIEAHDESGDRIFSQPIHYEAESR